MHIFLSSFQFRQCTHEVWALELNATEIMNAGEKLYNSINERQPIHANPGQSTELGLRAIR